MSHNPDFRDLFAALSAADARFLVVDAYDGVPIHELSREDLLTNKRAVARPQDLLDLAHLEKAKSGA